MIVTKLNNFPVENTVVIFNYLELNLTNDGDTAQDDLPLPFPNLTELEDTGQGILLLIIGSGDDFVSLDVVSIHSKHCQDDVDEDTNSEDGSDEDDEDHDVVSPDVLDDRE